MCWAKGSLSKDRGGGSLLYFPNPVVYLSPWKMFCALIKGHLETLHYFISLCFGSSCAKVCIKMWEGGGVRESVFSVVTVLSLWLFTLYSVSAQWSHEQKSEQIKDKYLILFFCEWWLTYQWCILSSRQSNFCSKQCYCF